jgi:hypothetical protein
LALAANLKASPKHHGVRYTTGIRRHFSLQDQVEEALAFWLPDLSVELDVNDKREWELPSHLDDPCEVSTTSKTT